MSAQQHRLRVTRPFGFTTVAVLSLLVGACGHDMTGPGTDDQRLGPERTISGSPSPLEVYIHAHQDDWQFFMGDRTYYAIKGGKRVLFVYATAGDAGMDQNYWQTRELAAQASVDSIAGADAWTCTSQTIRTHPIRRCTKGPTISYYMRMPDGNGSDGTGYGKGSLVLLRDNGTATAAIDGSTTYTSWSDFYTTIAAIVDFESSDPAVQSINVNAPDDNRTLNPGDHPDHYATADAVKAVIGLRGWGVAWYVDYEIRNRLINLSDFDHAVKQTEWYAYDDVLVAAGYPSLKSDSWRQRWMWRTYFRVQPAAAPSAPSGLTATAVSSSEVDLTWTDNAATETEFRIHRATTAGFTPSVSNRVATVAANTVSYRDGSLTASTTYYYKVVAANTTGSATSNEASVTTQAPPPQPPAGATSLLATAASTSQIDLTWRDNSSNESGFKIERAPDNNGAAGAYIEIAGVSANVISYSNTGLNAGTKYWYRVRAYNADGNAEYSNEYAATTNNTPPSNLALRGSTTGTKGKGSFKVDLSWVRGTAPAVDIWRNSSKIAAGVSNSGSYTDNLGNKRGTYTYQACLGGQTGTTNCTNTAAVSF